MRRLFPIALVLSSTFLFTGCFSVLQFLSLNPDGTISLHWRLTIPSTFAKKKKGASNKMTFQERMDKAAKELKDKLGSSMADLQIREIKTKYEQGMSMQMRLLKSIKLEDQDAMPVIPFYEKSQKRITFFFVPKERGESSIPLPPPAPEEKPQQKNQKEDHKENSKKAQNTNKPSAQKNGMEELAKMILSSAHYQIILGKEFDTKGVYLVDRKTKKRSELPFLRLGSQTVIDFPFVSLLMEHQKGYDVIVELK